MPDAPRATIPLESSGRAVGQTVAEYDAVENAWFNAHQAVLDYCCARQLAEERRNRTTLRLYKGAVNDVRFYYGRAIRFEDARDA